MGYYESWSPQRPCDAFSPSDLDPTRYTHLYYSFALIGGDGSVSTSFDVLWLGKRDADLLPRLVDIYERLRPAALERIHGLEVEES
jgi:GH18 family chitinase